MNKHLCALVLLGLAASAAQAQSSSVTLYGVLDAAVEAINGVGPQRTSVTRMGSLTGGQLPSRLGVRGSEDLGDGLKAVFTLESGIAMSNGTLNQGGRQFGRQAFVGLSGDWGSLILGRQYSMLFLAQLEADIFGPANFGSASLDSYLANARVDNAIGYRGNFGRWQVGGTFSRGRDTVLAGGTGSPAGTGCAGQDSNDSLACRQWSVLGKYSNDNWGVAAAIDEIRGGAGSWAAAGLTRSDRTDRRSTVTGWYKPSAALKFGAGVISRRNEGSATTPRSNLSFLGVSYAVTPKFVVDGELFKLDFKNSANQATLFTARASYNLSKQTAIYAIVGHIANDGTLAISVSNGAPARTADPAAGGSQTGIAAGIRHSF